jgi:ElaA protein
MQTPSLANADLRWQCCALDELPARHIHAVFAARAAVFVVEQQCFYQDPDRFDLDAQHLIVWSGSEIAAYLRVLAPGTTYVEPSLGRILTTKAFRGSGLGRELIRRGLSEIEHRYPARAVRIGAQAHLEKLYASFGFEVASAPYIEDGIPHIEMVRAAGKKE